MTSEEVRDIVREVLRENRAELLTDVEQATDRGIQRAFLTLGIDTEDPLSTQRDMRFVRDWRVGTETIRRRGIVTLVGLLVAGTAAALWAGIKTMVAE